MNNLKLTEGWIDDWDTDTAQSESNRLEESAIGVSIASVASFIGITLYRTIFKQLIQELVHTKDVKAFEDKATEAIKKEIPNLDDKAVKQIVKEMKKLYYEQNKNSFRGIADADIDISQEAKTETVESL